MSRIFRAAALLLAVASFFPFAASAQNTYDVYIDTIGAAGCDVVLPGGTFAGADRRLQATVTSGGSPQVTSVTFATCNAGTFGPGVPAGGGYPVGLNNGVGGSDVIELSIAVAGAFQGATSARFGFAAIGPGGSDVLFTANGQVGGGTIGTQVFYSIPMLGIGGLLLLAALMLLVAKRAGRHRLTLRLIAVGLLLTSGIALAANFVVDGQVGDWTGEPADAIDPAGDATNGAANLDLRAGFIAVENGNVFFRIDLSDLQNQSPIATPQAVTTNEDTPVTITLASTDPENDPRTYAIVTPPTNGTLGAITQVPPASATVQYTPNANFNGTDTFTFRATDSQGAVSAPATVTITVTPVNDAPVLTAGGTLAYTENAAATAIDTTITVSDIDSANLASATAQITTGYVNGEDVLACGACGAIVPAFNAATGTLTLTGAATLAQYQAALRSVTYANSSNNPATAARTVTWIGNDGGAAPNTSAPVTSTINVTAVNDAPVLTAGATLAYTENQAATAIDATVTVTDSDSANLASATVSITTGFQNGADVLACGTCGAIVPTYAAATGVLTLTGSATLAQYQAALRSVTYNNSSDNPTTTARTITWVGNDGTTNSAPVTSTVTVAAVNDAPVLTAGGTLNYTENQAPTAIDATITVTDLDNTNLASATAAITGGFQTGQDVLACGACGAIVPAYNAGTGVLTLTGSATLAAYQAALRSVTYANTSDGPNGAPRTITWIGNDGTASSAAVTSTVNVIPVNDAPVLTAGATASYTENSAAVVIDNTVTVNDADNANLASATVSITTGFQNGADVLACGTCGTIVPTYAAATGVLTLTGSATLAQYQTALRSVTYNNTSDNPTTTARTITWIGNDGTTASAPVTSTVNVTAVNDPPVLTAGGTLTYTENNAPAAIDATITVNDVDNANLASATAQVTGNYQNGQDVLACPAGCGGLTANFAAASGTLTLTGSATLATYQTALRSVTYSNSSESPSSAPRTITWIGNDGTVNSAPVTSTVNVIPVNDAPILTAGATAAYTENAAAVVIDNTVTVNDVDNTNLASATVSITAGLQAQDVLACVTCGTIVPTYVAGTGTLTLTGSATLANYQTALRSITFVNTGDNPGTARTITWIGNDGTTNSAPVTSTINVTAVNDPPVLAAGAVTAYAENAAAVQIDNTITVTDVDNANLANASAAITAGFQSGADVLACSACGPIVPAYNGGTGVLTLTGSATLAAYQAALRSVTFVNSSENPTAGPRTITWIGNDGTAPSVPVTSTVNVTPTNDPPVNAVPGAQNVADTATLTFPGNISVADVDVGAASNFRTTVSIGAGTLTAAASGATLVGQGTNSVQITGTIAQVNTALNGLGYDPVNGTTSTQTLTVLTTDQGNTGGPAQTDTDTVTINVDQAPTITATVPTNGALAVDPSADLSVTFSETVNFAAGNFTVACGGPAFTTVVTGTGTNTATINPTGNIDAGTTCTLTINGVGITDVDAIDPPGAIEVGGTTVVTFTTAAIANDDNFYTATPNLTLTVPAPGAPNNVNVFANDVISGGVVVTGYGAGPAPANCATVPPTVTTATAGGGTVSMTTTGNFVFNGAPGARTTDSFCYTITGGDSATVTATFQGAQAIWFVDPNAAPAGNGTQARPFQNAGSGAGTFATATGDIAGDTVFIADGASACGVTLLANQRVVGDGASGTLAAFATGVTVVSGSTLPTFSGTDPVLSATGAGESCFTLASGNTVRGLTIGNSTLNDVLAAGPYGTFTITETTLGGTGTALNLTNGTLAAALDDLDVTSSGGAGVSLTTSGGSLTTAGGTTIAGTSAQGILVTGSSGNFNFGATTVTNPGGTGIDIQGATAAATVTFAGAAVTRNNAGVGVSLGTPTANNAAATLTFGDLDITNSNGGTALLMGTSPISTTAGTILATNAIAMDTTGATFAATFDSVTSTGSAGAGITLTTSTGSLAMNAGAISTNAAGFSAFRVNGSAGTAISYAGGITKTSNGHLVEISGAGAGNVTLSGALSCTGTCGAGVVGGIRVASRTGGTIALSNTSKVVNTATNQAIVLDTNNGATINFSNGGLDVDTTSGIAFDVVGGGTVSVSGGSNAIDATTGIAFRDSGTGGNAAITIDAPITNTTGRLIDIQGRLAAAGAANVTLSGNLSNGGTGILLSGNTIGTYTFSGGTKTLNTGASNAVTLTNNSGAAMDFTGGGLAITTTSGGGFIASGAGPGATTGGTVTIPSGATVNTISSGTGSALALTNTTIGSTLAFRSITSNGSGNSPGIILDNTGGIAGLTVAGNGGACTSSATCTGGTISNKTGGNTTTRNGDGTISVNAGAPVGVGIFLRSTRDISLTRMQVNDFSNYAVLGSGVTNFTADNSNINGTAGDTVNAPAPPEGTLYFNNLTGNAALTNSVITNLMPTNSTRITDTIHVMNNGGTLTLLNIDNCTIANTAQVTNPGGKDAIFFGTPSGAGSGAMNLTINNSRVSAAFQFLAQVNIQGTATSNVILTGNTFTDTNEAIPNGIASAGGGINLTGGGTDVYVKYLVQNNSFRHNSGAGLGATNAGALLITGIASGTGTFDGRIINNTFGVTGIARSGSGNGADALRLFASGNNGANGNTKVLVQGNTIKNYGEVGIQFNSRQGNARMDITVLNNVINEPGPVAQGSFAAIWANVGALPGDTNQMNIAIGGLNAADKNTMQDSDPSNATDVFLDRNSCGGCASVLTLFRNGSGAAGAGEALIRQILVDDNNPVLDLLAGFTNGSTIATAAGLPPQPSP